MTITQTYEIPADRRINVEVPREVQSSTVILTFTPANTEKSRENCPICAKHRDPVTDEPLYNAETKAAIDEGDAILRGEIPAKRYSSLQEMLVDLDADD